MSEAAFSSRRWRNARYAITFAALAGLVFWLLKSQAPNVLERAPAREASAGELARDARSTAAIERAADGLPIKPADPYAAMPDGPMHPHPITAAHERIYRENNLVGALNLAVDLENAARIRALLAQYRDEYPEDAHRLQSGYAIIADCLERLDGATRERAQRFWSTEIRSQTRRYVRRYCLERERAPIGKAS